MQYIATCVHVRMFHKVHALKLIYTLNEFILHACKHSNVMQLLYAQMSTFNMCHSLSSG